MSTKVLQRLPVPILLLGSLVSWRLAAGRPDVEELDRVAAQPPVAVVEAQPRDLRLMVRSQGTVEPRIEIDLVAGIAGRVVAVAPSLAAGGVFESGSVLVQLESHDAQVARDRAMAVVARWTSEVGLAEQRLVRLRALARENVVSPSQLEETAFAAEIAGARLREARAEAELSSLELERTRVRAPFAGRVRSKRIDVGQFVSPGSVLARLYSLDQVEVRLPVLNTDLRYLDLSELGGPADGSFGPEVRFHTELAGRTVRWTGQIVRTEAEIDSRSRMLHLVARMEDLPPPAPTVGLFVEAEIVGRRLESVFALPRTALRATAEGRAEVLVVDDFGRVRSRSVELLRTEDERVLIGAGLTPGEHVCVSASQTVPGAQVSVVIEDRFRPSSPRGR